MAKRINKNMVAALAFVGFGIMTTAGVLMILALRNTDPESFVEIAKQHAEAEEWQEAGLYYHRAYDVSQDEKYLVEVGQMVYNSGNEAKAYEVWQAAATRNPQLVSALVKLMDYDAEVAERFPTGKSWRRVRESSENLLELRPEDPKALYNHARALLSLRGETPENLEVGTKELRRAVELAPENVDYGLALAMLEAQEGASADADAFFERLLKAHAESGSEALKVRTLYGRLLASRAAAARARRQNDEAESFQKQARALLEEGVALAGQDLGDQVSARVQLGRYLAATELQPLLAKDTPPEQMVPVVDPIKSIYSEAIAIDPDSFAPYLALGELHRSLGNQLEAIEVYEQRLGKDIDRKGFRGWERKRDLFRILISAADTCVWAAKDLPFGSEDREALLEKGDGFVRDAKAEMPMSPQGYQSEGKLLLARGKDLDALAAFEEADKRFATPNSETRIYLASLYMMQKQVGAAEQAMEDVVRNPQASNQAWLTYARVLLAGDHPDKAIQAAQQALAKRPNDRETLLVLAESFRRVDRPDRVDEIMSQLDAADPGNRLVRARALVSRESYAEALAEAKALLKNDPGNTEAAVLAVRLHRKLEQSAEARAVADTALQANPNDLKLKKLVLALADDLSQEEREARYLAIIESTDDDYVRAMELAKYHESKGQWDEAEKNLSKAEQLLADRATPMAIKRTRAKGEAALREASDRRFSIVCAREDWDAAEQLAQDAAAHNVDGVDGLTYFGRVQLFRGEAELAADSFRQALDRQPNNSQTVTYLGQAYLDLKRLDQAQTAFEQAVKLNPSNGLAHKGLAMLAKHNRDAVAYHEHLTECLRLLPADEWTAKEVSRLQKLTNPEESIAEFEKKWKDNPEDVETAMSLADLYARVKRYEDASARFDDARKLAPDSLVVALTASEFERQYGSKTKAEAIIKENIEAQSESRSKAAATLLLAQFYTANEQFEKADATFLAAADEHQGIQILWAIGQYFFKTSRPEMAVDWLEKASQKALEEGNDDQRQQIDKMCAEAYLSTGSLDKAQALVEDLLARDAQPGNLALMFKAEIEAQRGRFDQAAATLTEFLEGRPDHALALYRRARYHGVQGKWSQALEDLELLRARRPDALGLAPRKRLAIAYERVGRVESATNELETLLNEHTDDSDLAVMLVELLLRHDRFDEAERTCREMANRQPQNATWPYQRAKVLLRRAEQIDDGQTKKKLAQQGLANLRQACDMSDFSPSKVVPYLNACRTYEAYDDGIALYEKSLDMSQRIPVVTKAYAGLLAKAGATDLAISAYRRAAHVGRKQSGAMFVQAVAGDAMQTVGADPLISLLRQPPQDDRLLQTNQLLLAAALASQEQFSEANTILKQSLDQATEDVDRAVAWLLLGTSADQAGDFERARQAYEELIKIEPANWVAHNNLAYLLCERLQRCAEALPYAQRAISVTSRPAVADTLASVYLGLDRARDAVGIMGRALNESPRFAPGYLRLGEAYRRLNEFDAAQAVLEQAQNLPDTGLENFTQDVEEILSKVRNRDSSH
ncbi:MAG: tetratricopeptide repeat protein [Phycisphaerae bacterium]